MANNPDTSVPSDLPERNDAAQDELRVADIKGDSITVGNVSGTGIAIGPGAQANVVFTEEQAYNASGLTNPYLGLRAFTAAERDIFAGRERTVRALVDRLSAEDGNRLLFIVGASGSGKSSLARAGLLPALAEQFSAHGYAVQTRIIDHPGRAPATALARMFASAAPSAPASASALLLLLIDQFEELFSQVDADERERTLSFVAEQASTAGPPVRIIATLRSDFLQYVLDDQRFEGAEQRKVVVRAMTPDELQDAIQRPIQVYHPNKRFEQALVERLANDAAADAAYLPLLQVTLEDLWRNGDLRLAAYKGITDSIQRRADAVYAFRDHDGLQQERRTPDEQQVILSLFLDLVRVSLEHQQRDVRWRRSRVELTRGDSNRELLLTDLTRARLLRTDRESIEESAGVRELETVDIIHEALLKEWSTLNEAINGEREQLRCRERLLLTVAEWQTNQQSDDYLLMGVRLAEAEALMHRGDGIFLRADVQQFVELSVAAHAEEQKRQIALVEARAQAEEQARLEAEQRAQAEQDARQQAQDRLNVERRLRNRDRVLIVAVSLIAIFGLGAIGRLELLRLRAQTSVHLIAVQQSSIRLEQYEVTNERYGLCVSSGVCIAPPGITNRWYYRSDGASHPVVGIDGLQAAQFCRWIGRRLPRLDEWEQAVALRGDWTQADYDRMAAAANFLPEGPDTTSELQPVGGEGRATADGIYDLFGNAWELTATGLIEATAQTEVWDGTAEHAPERLIAKGGGFQDTRTATIGVQWPRIGDRWPDVGFRCAAD